MSKSQHIFILGVIVATIVLCGILTFDLVPALRGPTSTPESPVEWQWRYRAVPDITPWKLVFPLGVISLIAIWAYVTRKGKVNTTTLLVLAVLALSFRLATQFTSPNGMMIIARTLNPAYFGYFEPAAKVQNLPEFLHNYDEVRQTHYRMGSHPPGNVVFYWLIIRVTESVSFASHWAEPLLQPRIANLPEWGRLYTYNNFIAAIIASLLIPFISTLAILPIYALVRMLWDDYAAWLAVLIYIFIPAVTVFTPVIDDLYCIFSACTFYFLLSGLHQKSVWRIAAAGAIISVGLFMNFSFLTLIIMASLTILLYYARDWRTSWRLILRDGITLGVVSSLVRLGLWVIVGLNPILDYSRSLNHLDAARRAYIPSIFYGAWDIIMFAGIPLAIHWLLAFGQAIKENPTSSLKNAFIFSVTISLALLFVAGSLRGEVARTILLVFPIITVAATGHLRQTTERAPYYVAVLIVLMAIQTITFQVTLDAYH